MPLAGDNRLAGPTGDVQHPWSDAMRRPSGTHPVPALEDARFVRSISNRGRSETGQPRRVHHGST